METIAISIVLILAGFVTGYIIAKQKYSDDDGFDVHNQSMDL
jgi:hypothetical protein